MAGRFRIEPLSEQFLASDLAREVLGQPPRTRAFAITEHATGRRYYVGFGRQLVWDVRLDDTGLRLVGGFGGPVVYDGLGRRAEVRWVEELYGDRVAVLRPGHVPVLVDVRSGRVQAATWSSLSRWGLTARFPVPGAPEGVIAEYQFTANGWPVREDLPLTGGDAGAAHLASLRVRVENPRWNWSAELYGPGSELFRLGTPHGSLPGFTVTEPASGFQFVYGYDGGLLHWDLPLEPGRCLRVPAGGRAGDPHLVDAQGKPLSLTEPTTVRVPVVYAPQADGAAFWFDASGRLVRQEWPLAGENQPAALGSLRVVMERGADPSVPGWTYELVVPSGTEGVTVRQEWPLTADGLAVGLLTHGVLRSGCVDPCVSGRVLRWA